MRCELGVTSVLLSEFGRSGLFSCSLAKCFNDVRFLLDSLR